MLVSMKIYILSIEFRDISDCQKRNKKQISKKHRDKEH
jgi:hypothetical protein